MLEVNRVLLGLMIHSIMTHRAILVANNEILIQTRMKMLVLMTDLVAMAVPTIIEALIRIREKIINQVKATIYFKGPKSQMEIL